MANCDPHSNSSISSDIGGSISITETWSETTSVGVGVGDVKFDQSFGWSQSTGITFSQTITIEVMPGYMVCHLAIRSFLVAYILHSFRVP